jgi:type II secretory pathway pseudopilin PulG
MVKTIIELGIALAAIGAAGLVLLRIWDNQRDSGRKQK